MKNYLLDKKAIIIGSVVLIVLIIVLLYFYKSNENDDYELEDLSIVTTSEVVDNEKFYVDVKGAVKDPGVYLVENGARVIDAITLAGGLEKNANTGNINLSQRLESEMVVYVYTNKEVKSGSVKSECDTKCNCEVVEVNNCVDTTEGSELVNINTASLEELMTLSGVGESKAKAIISYREENGNFESIEDLKNVSGIGDAMFEKIKGEITV